MKAFIVTIIVSAMLTGYSKAEEMINANAVVKAFANRDLKLIQNLRPQEIEKLPLKERNAVALAAAKSLPIKDYIEVIGTNSIHKCFTKPPVQDSPKEAECRRQWGINMSAAELLRHLSEKRMVDDPSLLPYLIEALDHPDRSFVGQKCFNALTYLTRHTSGNVYWARLVEDEKKHEEISSWWTRWLENNKDKHPVFDTKIEQQARMEFMRLAEQIENELKPLYPSLSMFSAPKDLPLLWSSHLFHVEYNPRCYALGPSTVDHDELPWIHIRCELLSKELSPGAAWAKKEIPTPPVELKNLKETVYSEVLPKTDILIEVLVASTDEQLIKDLRSALNKQIAPNQRVDLTW